MMFLKDLAAQVEQAVQIVRTLVWDTDEKGPCAHIDEELCQQCGACHDMCPKPAVGGCESITEEGSEVICLSCSNCLAFCRHDAVTVDGLPPATLLGPLPSRENTLDLLEGWRRSIRRFKDKEITQQQLDDMIRVASAAPKGHNTTGNVCLVIVKNRETIRALAKMAMGVWEWMTRLMDKPGFAQYFKKALGEETYKFFAKLAKFIEKQRKKKDPLLFSAPLLMFFCGKKGEMMAKYEASFAASNVMTLVPTIGLGSCLSGVLVSMSNSPGFKKLVKIPRDYEVHGVLMIGHPRREPVKIPYRELLQVFWQ